MGKQKKLSETKKLIQQYNTLSPMMKIMFSGDAQQRNATDGSLNPILTDLTQADQLVNFLLKFQFKNPAQAHSLIIGTISPLKRQEKVLNYVVNALVVGDAIVFRMAYAHGKLYSSMKDFNVVHPVFAESTELQRQIAFLKRMNRTDFDMKNPEYSKYYREWVASSSAAKAFDQRRENYTLALSDTLKELGFTFKRIPLPYTGVGRAYIKEVSRQRS